MLVVCGPEDRRRAGTIDSRAGVTVSGALHVDTHAWSLDGPMPDLHGVPLGQFARVHMGIVCGDYPRYVHEERKYPEDRPTCRGRDIRPWHIDDPGLFVRYLPRDMLQRKPYVAPKHAGLFDVPEKVVLAGATGRRLVAAMDTERRFPMDSCYVVHPRKDEDPYAILGLLLSEPVRAWYGARFGAPRVKGVEVATIPVPRDGWAPIADAARARDIAAVNACVAAAYEGSRLEAGEG